MPIHSTFFDSAVQLLQPVLSDLPGRIIVIDGKDGTGKSTLGRYLSWYFNVSLIESDNFLIEGRGLEYDTTAIESIIRRRLNRPRPVILEGVVPLRILKALNREADFHIHLCLPSLPGSESLRSLLAAYEAEFRPLESANAVLLAKRE
jgi:2-phosphoglycerate kinase